MERGDGEYSNTLSEAQAKGREEGVLARIRGLLMGRTTLAEVINVINEDRERLAIGEVSDREARLRRIIAGQEELITSQRKIINSLSSENKELRERYENLEKETSKLVVALNGLVNSSSSGKLGLRAAVATFLDRVPKVARGLGQVEQEERVISPLRKEKKEECPRARRYLKGFARVAAVAAVVGGFAYSVSKWRFSSPPVETPVYKSSATTLFQAGPEVKKTPKGELVFEVENEPVKAPVVSSPEQPSEEQKNETSYKTSSEGKSGYRALFSQTTFSVPEGKTVFSQIPIADEGWEHLADGKVHTLGDVKRMVVIDGLRAIGRNVDCPQIGEEFSIDKVPEGFKDFLEKFSETKDCNKEFLKLSEQYQDFLASLRDKA
ncbi:MAG TPA: hypothetical protein VMW25_03225 [Clostridia bacterium]|nr:hypothetical protein [Clostridia bacterium]